MAEKTTRKGPERLQFYDGFSNLIKSGGLAALINGVYGKSRITMLNVEVKNENEMQIEQ